MINDFKDLLIWQKGMEIAKLCYFLTKTFPKEELFGMVQQIRRAASSIPANISEGYGRRSLGDYRRFLNIAVGSANELQTHLILSASVNLCTQQEIQPILDQMKEELKMITSLINKLEGKK